MQCGGIPGCDEARYSSGLGPEQVAKQMSDHSDGLSMWQLWPPADAALSREPPVEPAAPAELEPPPAEPTTPAHPTDDWQSLYLDFDRSQKQPWVMLNMVQSIDGAVVSDGVSGGLSSPADKQVFSLVRSLADIILVGANTVLLENYGPPKLNSKLQAQRLKRGQLPLPEIAVVTGSLSLEPTSRIFTDSQPDDFVKPLILTVKSSAEQHQKRRAALSDVAEVIAVESPPSQNASADVPAGAVDLRAALDILSRRTPTAKKQYVVLCEGGPRLNAQLASQGIIDELFVSLSPHLIGGQSPRLLHGASQLSTQPELSQLSLLSAVTDGSMLFFRYGFAN